MRQPTRRSLSVHDAAQRESPFDRLRVREREPAGPSQTACRLASPEDRRGRELENHLAVQAASTTRPFSRFGQNRQLEHHVVLTPLSKVQDHTQHRELFYWPRRRATSDTPVGRSGRCRRCWSRAPGSHLRKRRIADVVRRCHRWLMSRFRACS